MKFRVFSIKPYGLDLALLLLRVAAGGFMAINHGYSKLINYEKIENSFPEVFGLSASLSANLAIFSELVCAALVAIGFLHRWVLIPLIVTMAVAAFDIHWDDPIKTKEHALLFLIPYITLFLTGPGRYSIDALIARRR